MKKMIKYIIMLVLIFIVIILTINSFVKIVTKNKILDEYEYSKLENIDCIIVLGAGIWGDKPSPMLEDRLKEAISLYNQNISSKIIMSGDHGKEDYERICDKTRS